MGYSDPFEILHRTFTCSCAYVCVYRVYEGLHDLAAFGG